jgi:hypothetical protein
MTFFFSNIICEYIYKKRGEREKERVCKMRKGKQTGRGKKLYAHTHTHTHVRG